MTLIKPIKWIISKHLGNLFTLLWQSSLLTHLDGIGNIN